MIPPSSDKDGKNVFDPDLVWSISHTRSDRTSLEKKAVTTMRLSLSTWELVEKDAKVKSKANDARASMLALGGIFNAQLEVIEAADDLQPHHEQIQKLHYVINRSVALMAMEMFRQNNILRNAGRELVDAPKVALDDESKLFTDEPDQKLYEEKRSDDCLARSLKPILVGARGGGQWRPRSRGNFPSRGRGYGCCCCCCYCCCCCCCCCRI